MSLKKFASAVVLSTLPLAVNAASCAAPAFTAQHLKAMPQKPNQAVFSSAVALVVNFERCKKKRKPLATDAKVLKVAQIHSQNMAKTQVFSHTSNVKGAKTIKDRAKSARVKWRFLAENIALLHRYQFGNQIPFRVVDRKACKFIDPRTQKLIPVHSYASFAKLVVANWMASSGHKKNVLNKKAGTAATAAVFNGAGDSCGRYFVTQVLTD